MSFNVILPKNKSARCERSGLALILVVAMAAVPVRTSAAEKLGELDKYVRAPETAYKWTLEATDLTDRGRVHRL